MEGNSPLNNNFSFWVGKEATPSKTCRAKREEARKKNTEKDSRKNSLAKQKTGRKPCFRKAQEKKEHERFVLRAF
jgi:hypothetical protein